jgi:hypothetical protein
MLVRWNGARLLDYSNLMRWLLLTFCAEEPEHVSLKALNLIVTHNSLSLSPDWSGYAEFPGHCLAEIK